MRALCAKFPGEYWRALDRERAYPTAFVNALTEAGYLAALIPEEFGGSGLPISAAAAILEEVMPPAAMALPATRRCIRWAPSCATATPSRSAIPARDRQRRVRLQAFGVTEPTSGTDTLSLRTTARREGNDHYVINGQKIWTSRAEHSDLMLLLARTTPRERSNKRTDGLSVFIVDMRLAAGTSMTISPIRTMMNHATTQVFFDDLRVPAENLIGEEGQGFRYILGGMNAERILIAAECIGDCKWFIGKASAYAQERVLFGRPDRQEPGCAISHRARLRADARRRIDGA